MSVFVLDASVAVALLLREEETPEVAKALKLLENGEVVVPYLWHIEMRNVIVKAMRRDKHDASWAEKSLLALMICR